MKSTRTRAKNDVIGSRRSEPIILSDFLPQFYQGRVCKYAARSPVFAAMFKNPMKECRENKVYIVDVYLCILQIMLTYMYTGKMSNLTVFTASELLYVADKYQLQDLKRVCCYFLEDNISLGNVLKILVLGDLHCEDLKSSAIDYICNKCTKFSVLAAREEWETLRKERPELAMDILTSVVISRDEK
ncbi:Speckle-type POZ protein-like [Araneus ventricosus]|uniref:Speckle-type POZ protein-like n=1 Tax=Araneus ventricosus TaxID=182803 RepID=A0A4Y2K1V6_ARAVE|nr:Speckle-type POZ protein-like [Araneus ventricosus]